MTRFVFALAGLTGALLMGFGCRKPAVTFPETTIARPDAASGALDVEGVGEVVLYTNAAGRVDRIGRDIDGDGEVDEVVELDRRAAGPYRHLVLILDGVSYETIREYYEAGHFRVLHPPSRVVATYPTLTDLCMEDIFGYVPCDGFEAKYFSRRKNRLVGGSTAYLAGENEPYNRLLDYRANLIWDAIGYVKPWPVFEKEANDAKRGFDASGAQEYVAYFVSSAGVATRHGKEGQLRCLAFVERMVNQVVCESRGLTRVTLLADHGHTYTPAERIPLEQHLRERGWRLRNSLDDPEDVVYIRFGLETYASFAALRPAALAEDLVAAEGVELASYADGADVVVLAPGGQRAVIRHRDGRFAYEPASGDPLEIADALRTVQADADGYCDADALLAATADGRFPAPLQRLWRAHFDLVPNPPDVIVSLADEYYSGSRGFGKRVTIDSTHGGLNRANSVTFIMSSAGPLPPLLRSSDIPDAMRELLDVPRWPMQR